MRRLLSLIFLLAFSIPAWAQSNVLLNYRANSTSVLQVSPTNPLPISGTFVTGGSSGTDGSGTIAAGNVAQNLFAGATPTNGFAIYNPDASEDCWVSLSTTALANGTGSIRVVANGGGYETPAGLKPFHAISIVCVTTGHKLTAIQW